MEFIYKGRKDGPEKTVAYGITFERGETVEVDDDYVVEGVDVCMKLSGNPNFVQVQGKAEVLSKGSTEGNDALEVKSVPKASKKKVSKKK